MRLSRVQAVLTAFLLLAGAGAAVSFPVDEQADWEEGNFTNTTVSHAALQLSGSNLTGRYTSAIIDAGDNYTWSGINTSSLLGDANATVTVTASYNDNFSTGVFRRTFNLSGGQERFETPTLPETRYIRFNYSLQRDTGSDPLYINQTNLTLGGPFHFLIRNESCQPQEKELFTMSGRENAHAGNPGQYTRRVCASSVDRSDYTQVCTVTETPVISFFGSGNPSTHLATEPDRFDYKLCTRTLTVGVRKDSCPTSTKAMVSVYEKPSGHIAEPGFYDWQLCGAFFFNVTLATEFGLGPDETVALNGSENPATGLHRVGLPSSISASNGSVVAGIVSGERTRPFRIGYDTDSGALLFNMTQSRTREVSYYVPFTEGTDAVIQDRLPLIESGTFLDELNPNFGLTLLEEMVVEVTLPFSGIDIVTDTRIAPGMHRLIIENVGTTDGTPEVSINATTP